MKILNRYSRLCAISGAFLALLSLAGCGGSAKPEAKDAKKDETSAVPVEVAKAVRAPIAASYNGTATLTTDREAQVAAKTSGVLVKLYVEEGQHVKAGQVLAQLEDAPARAQLAQAEAQMRKADSTFAYGEVSMQKQLISKREYDQAKYDMQNLRAAYESARLQLQFTTIVAPIDGVIAERSVKLGNLVQTNQNLFRIVGMDALQAILNVPERQLGILRAGQSVTLQADALPGRKFAGSILRIAPVVDSTSGTFRVTCQFDDGNGALKPGMFGRIDIVYDRRADALVVPRSALIEEDGETAVFVVNDLAPAGKDAPAPANVKPGFYAHRKLVKTGYGEGDRVEIREGLDEGAMVVTVGRNAVRDGAAVQVLDAGPDKSPAAGKPDGSRE